MSRVFFAGLMAFALVAAGRQAPPRRADAMTIERLDPALDRLIAPDAKIEVLAQGHDWTEGPVWIRNGGYLLFSDIPKNSIYRWKEGKASACTCSQRDIPARSRAAARLARMG